MTLLDYSLCWAKPARIATKLNQLYAPSVVEMAKWNCRITTTVMLLTAKHVRVAAKHIVGIVRVEAFWKGSLNWALHNTVLIC